MHYSVLIVDDEVELTEYTAKYFNMSGVTASYAFDAEGALDFFKGNTCSLILLDINLGGDSGFELCQEIRKNMDIPIFFISARTSEDDMLLGLSIGGDDYICKPYSLGVLLAKVKATLKRYESDSNNENNGALNESDGNISGNINDSITKENHKASNTGKSDFNVNNPNNNINNTNTNTNISGNSSEYIIDVGNVKLDMRKACIIKGDESIMLKAMEYKLLMYMIKNKNRILTKDELFEKVWETDYVGDVTLNVHIRHLREKIEEDASNPQYIKTVWGRGFMLEMNE